MGVVLIRPALYIIIETEKSLSRRINASAKTNNIISRHQVQNIATEIQTKM